MPCEKQIRAVYDGEPVQYICTHDGPCPFERIAELEAIISKLYVQDYDLITNNETQAIGEILVRTFGREGVSDGATKM